MQLSVDIEPAKRGEPIRVTAEGVEMVILRAMFTTAWCAFSRGGRDRPARRLSGNPPCLDQDDNPADYEVYREP